MKDMKNLTGIMNGKVQGVKEKEVQTPVQSPINKIETALGNAGGNPKIFRGDMMSLFRKNEPTSFSNLNSKPASMLDKIDIFRAKPENVMNKDNYVSKFTGVGPKNIKQQKPNYGIDFAMNIQNKIGMRHTEATKGLVNSVTNKIGMKFGNVNFNTEKLGFNRIRQQRGLSMFGDVDRDGVSNILDCNPWDRKKQGAEDNTAAESDNIFAGTKFDEGTTEKGDWSEGTSFAESPIIDEYGQKEKPIWSPEEPEEPTYDSYNDEIKPEKKERIEKESTIIGGKYGNLNVYDTAESDFDKETAERERTRREEKQKEWEKKSEDRFKELDDIQKEIRIAEKNKDISKIKSLGVAEEKAQAALILAQSQLDVDKLKNKEWESKSFLGKVGDIAVGGTLRHLKEAKEARRSLEIDPNFLKTKALKEIELKKAEAVANTSKVKSSGKDDPYKQIFNKLAGSKAGRNIIIPQIGVGMAGSGARPISSYLGTGLPSGMGAREMIPQNVMSGMGARNIVRNFGGSGIGYANTVRTGFTTKFDNSMLGLIGKQPTQQQDVTQMYMPSGRQFGVDNTFNQIIAAQKLKASPQPSPMQTVEYPSYATMEPNMSSQEDMYVPESQPITIRRIPQSQDTMSDGSPAPPGYKRMPDGTWWSPRSKKKVLYPRGSYQKARPTTMPVDYSQQ